MNESILALGIVFLILTYIILWWQLNSSTRDEQDRYVISYGNSEVHWDEGTFWFRVMLMTAFGIFLIVLGLIY
jgi:Ca2+/Na+ antiporter